MKRAGVHSAASCPWKPSVYSRLCSAHFISGAKSEDPLSPDFVPSIFAHVCSPMRKHQYQKLSAYIKRMKMKKKRREATHAVLNVDVKQEADCKVLRSCSTPTVAHDESEATSPNMAQKSNISSSETQPRSAEMDQDSDIVNTHSQTVIAGSDIDALEEECRNLRLEANDMKSRLQSVNLDLESLKDNNEKVRKLTGLTSYSLLLMLFEYVSKGMLKSPKVSPFQQFFFTLMRLRFNLSTQFLSCYLNIDQSTVSRLFNNAINVMNDVLVPYLVFWPEREQLRKTIPVSFRQHFRKCVCIIDCFEIFIERPSDLKARAQTYSNYKSHNTAKYLIAVTPQGHISFISKGWGGRASDKYITENSGFLNNLLPGDVILADRGFDVGDSVGLYNAELKIPAFTKGKDQLSPIDVETTRRIASQRIHVERVIGLVRQKYSILQSTIPITMLQNAHSDEKYTVLDKIVRVACALANTCQPIVPFE